MGELALIVILIRLVTPLLIFRFPITGVIVASIADWLDFTVLGSFEYYQILDKWLDYYFLLICALTMFKWKDTFARNVAWVLFAYRTIGDIIFTATNQEWLLLIFPDFFGFFFFFYLVYVRLSKTDILFTSKKLLIPVFIGIGIPKLLQEYGLHIAYPYPELAPTWFWTLLELPLIIRFLLVLIVPAAVMTWLVLRARKARTTPSDDAIIA